MMAVAGISIGAILILYGLQNVSTLGRILAGLEIYGLWSAANLALPLITLLQSTQDQKKVSSGR
jgi:hypothetical protein